VPDGTGHYYEIRYFVESLLEGKPMDAATPESTKETIRLAEAEIASADRGGALLKLS
jgi:predicted dehydrogenase